MMRTRVLVLALALALGAVQGCHHKKGGGYLRPVPEQAR